MAKRYQPSKKKSSNGWEILLYLFIAGAIIQHIIPVLILGGLGFGGYFFYKKWKNQTLLHHNNQQIEHLKADIRKTDRQIKSLESYASRGEMEHYQELANQVLPHLDVLKQNTLKLREILEESVYERIQKKIISVRDDIENQLYQIEEEKNLPEILKQEKKIQQFAPELQSVYHNIKVDHEAILAKITASESGNKEELSAEHQLQMERFYDILEGYLKIKAEPKNYYNAQERLKSAHEAIELFDKDLDETLRQLNESDLHDFEVSLRILKHQTSTHQKGE